MIPGHSSDAVDPEALADEMRGIGGGELPHLHRLAQRLGVLEIVNDDNVAGDGYTLWTAQGPSIRLTRGLQPARRRFTLGHELCHVYLGHGHEGTPRSGDRCTDERLCDLTASALLMPRSSVTDLLDRPLRLAEVMDRAALLDVSIAALVVRINRLSRQRHALLRAGRPEKSGDRARWAIVSMIGLRRLQNEMLTFTDRTYSGLEGLAEKPRTVEFYLRTFDSFARCAGDASRTDRHLLGLFPVDRVKVRAIAEAARPR